MLIDLTHTFTKDMPVWPGDPCAKLYQTLTVEKDGLTLSTLETGLHVGTHMDAPLHFINGGAVISDIPVKQFQGKGNLIDARHKTVVTADLLASHSLYEGDIVLVWTNWSHKFGQKEYFENYPVLAEDFAQKLVEAKVALVGIDLPSPDTEPYNIHKILLGNNIMIVENLTNLAALEEARTFLVKAFPMKLEAEAAPVRVVAEIL